MLDFLNGSMDISALNETFMVLIPKLKDPKKVFEYRPISLCNVVYKLISKMLSNRQKNIFPSIISKSQSTSVNERLITDNVILAIKAFHSMHVGYMYIGKPFRVVKLDMMKAYDRVEWGFLHECCKRWDFLLNWWR